MENFRSQEEIAQYQAFQRGKIYIVQWLQLIGILLATVITFVAAINTPFIWYEWIAAGCALLALICAVYLTGIPKRDPKDRLLATMHKHTPTH